MIAVVIYGEFRTFEINLKENLKELFGEVTLPLHFYILTEKCEEYESKKKRVQDIISEFGYEIKYFENIDESTYYDKEVEDGIYNDFHSIQYNGNRDDFTPRLFYRRCLVNKIMNQISHEKSFIYSKVVSVRIFDMIFKRFRSLSFLNNPDYTALYYAVDSLFIGEPGAINLIFNINIISNIMRIDDISKFREFYSKNDHHLSQIMPMLALETIFQVILYNHFLYGSLNLRYDYTRKNINRLWNESEDGKTSRSYIIEIVTPYIQTEHLFALHCPIRK